jgi:cell wall-associated NlpC family hydrolase
MDGVVSMDRRKHLALVLLAQSLLAGSVFGADRSGTDRVVIVPVADMYSAPNENSDVVSQAILGSNVVTLQKKGKWLKVETADQYRGWIQKKLLREIKHPYADSSETAQVSSLFANIYRETDVTAHAPLMTLPFEARVEVVSKPDGNARWIEIRLPDGRTGWIQQGDVTFHARNLSIDESIELAKRFMGIPYLWGGRSSFGYDCSGFTQMLVRSRGILMPRDADLQAAWSGVTPVDRKDLQAGDLLFFGESEKKITHTGMYIGNGQFIHDTTNTHPVVQISRLDDEPWTRLLVASRRVK